MSLYQAIYSRLLDDPTVNNLVAGRIYPILQTEQARQFPAIIYQVGKAHTDDDYQGKSGLVMQEVTISCFTHDDYPGMVALKEAAYNALADKSGVWGGVTVQGCFCEDAQGAESIETLPATGPDYSLYMGELEFSVWFELAE